MRKTLVLFAVLLAVTTLLAGCGSSESGRYYCTDSLALSVGVDEAEDYLDLGSFGNGTLRLAGKNFNIGWSTDGEELTVTHGEKEYYGFITQGVITLSLDGLLYTFRNETAAAQTTDETGAVYEKPNALQRWWNGGWYGWWIISDATGEWKELSGSWYDCCASIYFDAAGVGSISVWDGGGELCSVDLRLRTEDALSRIGAARSTDGFFWGWRVGKDDWKIDPAANDNEKLLVIENGYFEDGAGSFRYKITLRPWGQLWDDMAGDANSLPGGYYSWYLPLVQAGEPMPESMSKSENQP